MDEALQKLLNTPLTFRAPWKPQKAVWDTMQRIPPVYIFDIRAFLEQPFHNKVHTQQQYQARMEVREVVLPEGIHLMSASMQSKSDGYIHIDVKHPYIHLFFALNDNRAYYQDTTRLDALSPGSHQGFLFQTTEIIGLWNARANDRFIEINISVPLFLTWCKHSQSLKKRVTAFVKSGRSGTLFATPQATTAQQRHILQALQHPIVSGKEWQEIYLRSKIMELVAVTFDQPIQAETNDHPGKDMSATMIALMDKARHILDEELSNPPSIQSLSVRLGTNENYLKKYFKHRHHSTIRHYIITARLQTAKKLLHEGEKPIKEISHFLGYNSPAHFSASFKKHYGVNPKHIRNR